MVWLFKLGKFGGGRIVSDKEFESDNRTAFDDKEDHLVE